MTSVQVFSKVYQKIFSYKSGNDEYFLHLFAEVIQNNSADTNRYRFSIQASRKFSQNIGENIDIWPLLGHFQASWAEIFIRLLSIDQLWEMKGQYFFADFDLLGRFCWENRRGHHMLSQGSFRSIIITPLGVLFSRVLRTGYSGQWILCNVGIERNN